MEFITVLALLFLTFSACIKWKKIFALPVIFLLYWTVLVFFSGIRLYGLDAVSDRVYEMVLLSCAAFYVGASWTGKIKKKKQFFINSGRKIIIRKSAKWIFILSVAAVGIQIAYMAPSILRNGMAYARYFTLPEVMKAIGSLGIVIGYLGLPFLRAATAAMLVKMTISTLCGKDIWILTISVVIVLLSQGGRTSIMQLLIAAAYLVIENRKKLPLKVRRMIRTGIGTAVAGMILLTLGRGGNLFSSLYRYYAGALVYFTKALDTDIFSGKPFYGFNSFQGLLRPIFGVTHFAGIPDPVIMERADRFIMGIQHNILPVGAGYNMNFFVTCFGYMYRDGGFMAIGIISFLFGIVCKYVESMSRQSENQFRWNAVKIVLLQGICFTMIHFPFADYNTVMAMGYLLFITSNRNIVVSIHGAHSARYFAKQNPG